MKLTSALFIVALVLTVIGLFGITNTLVDLSHHKGAGSESGQLTAQVRNNALIVGGVILLGGIGTGFWAHNRYMADLPPEQKQASGGGSAHQICSICGTRLTRRQQARGVCGYCQQKAG